MSAPEPREPAGAGFDYSLIFNAALHPMAVSDAQSGIVIAINAAFVRVSGIERDQCLGRNGAALGLWLDPAQQADCRQLLTSRGRVADFPARLRLKGQDCECLIQAQVAESAGRHVIMWEFYDLAANQRTSLDLGGNQAQIRTLLTEAEQSSRALLSILEDERRARLALQQSEERFRTFIEQSADGLILVDENGIVREWNQACERITGFPRHDVLCFPVYDLTLMLIPPERRTPETIAAFRNQIGHILNGGELPAGQRSREVEAITRDGRRIVLQQSVFSIATAAGNRMGLILRDVTNIKRAEEALRASEEKYRKLVDSANEGILVAQDGMLKFTNHKTAEITGYTEQELLAKPYLDLVHPDDRPIMVGAYTKQINNQPVPDRMEFRFLAADGHVRWLEIHSVLIDWQGRLGTLNFLTDISERRQAEDALRESQERYRTLSEMASEGVLIHENWVILEANRACAVLLGLDHAEEIIGHAITDMAPFTAESMQRVKHDLQASDLDNHDIELIYPDGRVATAEVSGRDVSFHGRQARLVRIRDISERKLAEMRVLQSLREKETLLRELYHRTKNTLQIIRGMIVLQAAEFQASADVQRMVENTEQRIQAISLVHQMLYQSQDLSQISLRHYVQELCALVMQGFGLGNDRIRLDLTSDDQFVLLDTAIPFGFILNELLTNSVKYAFTDQRPGLITIRIMRSGEGRTRLLYTDNGVGVPPGFDFRHHGTLGLRLIFSIGEQQMNGRVDMKSGNGVVCDFESPNTLYKPRV
jgi:PAS domain S-box-containing protein